LRLHWVAYFPVGRPSSAVAVAVAAAFATGTSFVGVAFVVSEVGLVEHISGFAAWDFVAYAAWT